MKRFIRYLYEYKQGKRIRNIGFVKVEAGNEETIVYMQGKGFHSGNERKLVLYLFYEENGQIMGIRYAEINLATPVLSQHLSYTADEVGGIDNYSRINGVLIEMESGQQIAATWDDKPVDVGKMKEFAPESRKITKIQRKDISKLPRCEWKLANNQFLIHGYNNYHHLIQVEERNSLKLGVPGIYHIEEAKIADMFGFGEFLSAEELDIFLEPDEKHQDEPFGYWCRQVKRRMN